MDGPSFDTITRRLAVTTSRRRGIVSLVAGALGIAGISAAEAVVPVPPICRSTGMECTDGAECCSGRCIAKRLKNGGGFRCARKTSNRKKKPDNDNGGGGHAPDPGICLPFGDPCDGSVSCCTGMACGSEAPGAPTYCCVASGEACDFDSDCCGAMVCNGTCGF